MKDFNDFSSDNNKKDEFSVFPEFEKDKKTSEDSHNGYNAFKNDDNQNSRKDTGFSSYGKMDKIDSGKAYQQEVYFRNGSNKPTNSTNNFLKIFVAIFMAVILFASGFFVAYLAIPSEEEKLVRWINSTVDKYYYDGSDKTIDFTEAIGDTMVSKVDKYSSFYSPKDTEILQNEQKGDFEDSGLILYDYHTYIQSVYSNDMNDWTLSSAEKQSLTNKYKLNLAKPNYVFALKVYNGSQAYVKGIRAGDRLSKVGNEPVSGYGLNEINALLDEQRAENQGFNLTFINNNSSLYTVENLKAEKYNPVFSVYFDKQSSHVEDKSFVGFNALLPEGTAYISFEEFSTGADSQLYENLEKFKENNKTNLILDLRSNFGGSLAILQNVASMLIADNNGNSKNVPITVAKFKGTTFTYASTAAYEKTFADFGIKNIVVLADQNSASATELLILAMKDYNTLTTLIGKKTHGKAVMQQLFSYKNYSMYLTTAILYSAVDKEFTYNTKGFTPEKNIDWNIASVKKDDTQILEAISYINNLSI